jgi:hypothetical protein
VIGLRLGFTQWVVARSFAHEELLRIEFDEVRLMLGAVIGAIGKHGLVFVIEQFFKDLAATACSCSMAENNPPPRSVLR